MADKEKKAEEAQEAVTEQVELVGEGEPGFLEDFDVGVFHGGYQWSVVSGQLSVVG